MSATDSSADPPLYPTGGSLQEDIDAIRRTVTVPGSAAKEVDTRNVVKTPGSIRATDELVGAGHGFAEYIKWKDQDSAAIIVSFFNAIRNGQDDLINALILNGLVQVHTRDKFGRTPLYAAVASGQIRIVQQLVDFGADVNEYSQHYLLGDPTTYFYEYYEGRKRGKVVDRTPLMLAAEQGNLVIVKLFLEAFKADDSLIANDGQIALRLAAMNGHREVVEYLPIRKGGGLKRWKFKNRKAIRRMKHAATSLLSFFKALFYEAPKFFVWTLPKHLIVKPIIETGKFLYKNRTKLHSMFTGWVARMASKFYDFCKTLPKRLAGFAIRRMQDIKNLCKWIWKVLTVSLPHAISTTWKWSVEAAKEVLGAIWQLVATVISALHTLLMKLFMFIKGLTWADVMNGFIAILRWIFVNLPNHILEWTNNFGHFLGRVFGTFGDIVWFLTLCCWYIMTYPPKKLWVLLASIGDILHRGGHEVRVWYNPKAI